jgi:hypothetical protein
MNRWRLLMIICLISGYSLNAMNAVVPYLHSNIQMLNQAALAKDGKQFYLAALEAKKEDLSGKSCRHARILFHKHFKQDATVWYGAIKMLLDE